MALQHIRTGKFIRDFKRLDVTVVSVAEESGQPLLSYLQHHSFFSSDQTSRVLQLYSGVSSTVATRVAASVESGQRIFSFSQHHFAFSGENISLEWQLCSLMTSWLSPAGSVESGQAVCLFSQHHLAFAGVNISRVWQLYRSCAYVCGTMFVWLEVH